MPEVVSKPEAATPETATSETATPETATSEVVTSEVVTPEVVTPEVDTPEVVTPEVVTPEVVTIDELARQYEAILLDAFGVLVDSAGGLPGAGQLLQAISDSGRSFLIVTNDASRLPETAAARFERLGLPIHAHQIVTSGSLIEPYFAEHGLQGASCMVLGPGDSLEYVRRAGGRIAPIDANSDIDVLVIGNDQGFPFLQGVTAALNAVVAQAQRGKRVALLLPNPDVVFPKQGSEYGIASGAIALMIEAALERLVPGGDLRFVRLGKPNQPMFDEARRRAGTHSLVMVGDQLQTDIAGANNAGIPSALIQTGVSTWRADRDRIRPDYLLVSPLG